jgi:hypothetical protein
MGAAMTRFPLLSLHTVATCAVAALLLSGCAADPAGFPSLDRRPAERISGTAEPVTPAPEPRPPAPPSPELVARLAQLAEEAETAHLEFNARRSRTVQLVAAARGASIGSENWAQATVALAELETSRSRAMIALADLDGLYAAERTAGGDGTTIAAARDRVAAWIGEEDRTLADLRGQIAS